MTTYYNTGQYVGADGNVYEWDGPPYEHFMRTGTGKHDRIIAPVEVLDIPKAMNELDNLVALLALEPPDPATENERLKDVINEAITAISDMISYAQEQTEELAGCLWTIIEDLENAIGIDVEDEPEQVWDRSCL